MARMDSHPRTVNERKLAHLRAIDDETVDLAQDSFARWKLAYQALPGIALDEVSTETTFADRPVAAPLIISCMTGGAGEPFVTINRRLAEAAEILRIPFGLGSMKVLLNREDARASFALREVAPSVPFIANLGLVSFNYGVSLDHVRALVEILRPDIFGFHLNALQEAIQWGGDTDFRGLREALRSAVEGLPVPVYVKECGGGIHPRLVGELLELGVRYVDLSGRDGTSWSAVETKLSPDPEFGVPFRDFGLPTSWMLEQLEPGLRWSGRIVASGGMRNGVQAVKALALGADYVAMARPFMLAAKESTEAVVAVGRRFIREMRTAMFLVGAARLSRVRDHLLYRES